MLKELEENLADRVGDDAAARRVAAMREAFPDAEVAGYEALIDRMTCDEKDRHVLAAAVRADAAVIVTFNLKDFPDGALRPFDVAAVHPDDFLLDQLDLFPSTVPRVLDQLAGAYEHPAMTVEQLLNKLAANAPKFSAAVLSQL